MFPDFHAKSDTRMRELRSAEATGGSIYLIMELCTGGPLLEVPLDFPGLKNDALIADVGVESLSIQPEGRRGVQGDPKVESSELATLTSRGACEAPTAPTRRRGANFRVGPSA